jgi:hypothetical protein
MAAEPLDYAAFLADLEAKRDALNKVITDLKDYLGLESHAPAERGAPHMTVRAGGKVDIPSDAFFNMKIPDAIVKYLKVVRGKQSVRQITDAMEQGGLKSLAKDAYNNIYTTLMRMSKSPDAAIIKVGSDWALAEWYPRRAQRITPLDSATKSEANGQDGEQPQEPNESTSEA